MRPTVQVARISYRVVSVSTGHQVGDRQLDRKLYLKDRESKLSVQREVKVKAKTSEDQVMSNICVYINGFLENTTDIEMKKIVTRAGGRTVPTPSGCTHIVTSMQLSGSKTHKLLTTKSRNKIYVVKPEWVFDSIKSGKRLPEREYTILMNSTMKTLHDMVQKGQVASNSEARRQCGNCRPAARSAKPMHHLHPVECGSSVISCSLHVKFARIYKGRVVHLAETPRNIQQDETHESIPWMPSGFDCRCTFIEHTPGCNNTLHGGVDGYDRRTWTIAKKSKNAVTFALVDPDGTQGFPGTVTTEAGSTWKISINSFATELTPIMLSGHHYWNLEAYQETQDLVGHHAQFQASKFVATDGQLIPNGQLSDVAGTPMDFRKAKSIGADINATASAEYCGTGCVGFDNCWVLDKNDFKKPVFSIWSVNSGIKLDIITNQPAIQVYSCNGLASPEVPVPRKKDQGGPTKGYENHSCIVIESESIIDAINNPEFGIDQIYGPRRPYNWEATYVFSTAK
ncbi:hypothetical protein DXG01_003097 [Tephrocybe rancida]|nr:hypothetical protein DXG01_003097 [Tephrocybe rancida]